MPVSAVHELARVAGPMVALNEWQAGRCALCGGEVPLRQTVADHAHATGWVRALLCESCNTREARGDRRGDDRPRSRALARYLDHPVTAMLGLRISYQDTPGWRLACAAHLEAEIAAIRADLETRSPIALAALATSITEGGTCPNS